MPHHVFMKIHTPGGLLIFLYNCFGLYKENVLVTLTIMCLYSQDCGASASNAIIYPAGGDKFLLFKIMIIQRYLRAGQFLI